MTERRAGNVVVRGGVSGAGMFFWTILGTIIGNVLTVVLVVFLVARGCAKRIESLNDALSRSSAFSSSESATEPPANEGADPLASQRAYIREHLSLEDLRVGEGDLRFGETATCIFGTIVNEGNRTLRRVKVRVYYLDPATDKHIGELSFAAVNSSNFGSDDLDELLRPGYRKGFGYSLEKNAPPGWTDKVATRIEEIEFVD